jgi:hypothetical protein
MHFHLILALICSTVSVCSAVTILPQYQALYNAFTYGQAYAENCYKQYKPENKAAILKLSLAAQSYIGRGVYTWINTAVRANSSYVGAVLASPDAGLFLDIMRFIQWGDPDPYAKMTSVFNMTVYAEYIMDDAVHK